MYLVLSSNPSPLLSYTHSPTQACSLCGSSDTPPHSPLVHVLASIQQHIAAMSPSPSTSLSTRRTRATPPFWWKAVNLSPDHGPERKGETRASCSAVDKQTQRSCGTDICTNIGQWSSRIAYVTSYYTTSASTSYVWELTAHISTYVYTHTNYIHRKCYWPQLHVLRMITAELVCIQLHALSTPVATQVDWGIVTRILLLIKCLLQVQYIILKVYLRMHTHTTIFKAKQALAPDAMLQFYKETQL